MKVIFLLLALSSYGFGVVGNCTIFASPAGGGSGSTVGSPTTLAGASAASVPGSVICLEGGTYNIAAAVSASHSGTPSAYISYIAYGDSPASLVWTGGTGGFPVIFNLTNTSAFGTNSNYLKFVGLNFDMQNQGYEPFSCNWSHHIVFSSNYIKNTSAAGIEAKNCDYLTADHNLITHTGYLVGTASGITFNSMKPFDAYTGFHSIIANNIISGSFDATAHTDGNGIILDLSNSVGTYPPSTSPPTPPLLVANNVVYQNGGRCIVPNFVTQAWVVNNTCYGNTLDTSEVGIGEIVNLGSDSIHYVNNTAYSWNSHNPYQIITGGASLTWLTEMYFGGANNFSSVGLTSADPKFVSPPTAAAGGYSTALDPTLIGNKLNLQATSPAINAGIDPSTIAGLDANIAAGLRTWTGTDINGVLRPQGSAFDLGAYEFTSGPAAPTGFTFVIR